LLEERERWNPQQPPAVAAASAAGGVLAVPEEASGFESIGCLEGVPTIFLSCLGVPTGLDPWQGQAAARQSRAAACMPAPSPLPPLLLVAASSKRQPVLAAGVAAGWTKQEARAAMEELNKPGKAEARQAAEQPRQEGGVCLPACCCWQPAVLHQPPAGCALALWLAAWLPSSNYSTGRSAPPPGSV